MRRLLFLALLISSNFVFAKDTKNEWNTTVLTNTIIKKIQRTQFQYKKCVSLELQKMAKAKAKSSTDTVIKNCEKVLARMRQVYLDAKVPVVIADRHLKKMRIEMTRRAIKKLMFAAAARQASK